MKKYLDFYYSCLERGGMPDAGLCYIFTKKGGEGLVVQPNTKLKIFKPTKEDEETYLKELCYDLDVDLTYWASGGENSQVCVFTPLRQTIVLFMAAIEGELD